MPVRADVGLQFPGGEEQHHLLVVPLRLTFDHPPVAVLMGEGERLPPGEPLRRHPQLQG
jgi:hypothetical protein